VTDASFHVRASQEGDRRSLSALFAAVAEERDGIATEPSVDIEERPAIWELHGVFAGIGAGVVVGSLPRGRKPTRLRRDRHGCRAREAGSWRRSSTDECCDRDWARERGLHKLSLSVFAHNVPAIALYRKFGFVEEAVE
jgi:hypothetical protein